MTALESSLTEDRSELARRARAGEVDAGDAVLLRRMQDGDDDALEALLKRHGPAVYRVVFRLSGSAEEAEEIVQDTFLRLIERPPSPRDERAGDIGSWLRVVAARLAANLRRSERRRAAREESAGSVGAADATIGSTAEDPQVTYERAEARRRVRQALNRLPERQRQLLILRHSGYRYAEIAAVLGVAPSSIGTLLARAERQFRAAYGEEE